MDGLTWVLLVTLFSSPDVFLQTHSTHKECMKSLKTFEREHKRDKDIREVKCSRGFVLESDHDSFFAEIE